MKLSFKKLHPNAKLPIYASKEGAGMDIFACLDEPVVLHPGEAASVPTGLAVELPHGMEAQIRGRSGLAFKHAVFAFHGMVDSDFTGAIRVLLINHSKVPFTIMPDMRIAQMVVNVLTVSCRPEWADDIKHTEELEFTDHVPFMDTMKTKPLSNKDIIEDLLKVSKGQK